MLVERKQERPFYSPTIYQMHEIAILNDVLLWG